MSESVAKRVQLWPIFSRIRALVVLDEAPGPDHATTFGAGELSTNSYAGDLYFGLSEFIASLTDGGAFGSFAVTRAHRGTDRTGVAAIEHFRFEAHDLSVYDEIWLFGVTPGCVVTAHPLGTAELAALAGFMDAGGCVFSTGDHEERGVQMNGRVPRVRSMQKWYFPKPPPSVNAGRDETTPAKSAGSIFAQAGARGGGSMH